MKILFFCLLLISATLSLNIKKNEEKPRCTESITTASGTHAPDIICEGELIFEDNFDNLDFQKWEHENTLGGGGNWEFQWYSNNRTNSYTKDGNLYIRPSLLADQYGEGFLTSGVLNVHGGAPADACTDPSNYGCERAGNPENIINPIKSARLRTVQSFRFKYGRLEIMAKLPAGDWLWPALWLMPSHNNYGRWPASGEIDLMESRGNRQLQQGGVNIGVERVGSTMHYGPYPELNRWDKIHYNENDPAGFHSKFSRYQMEWTPDFIKFSVDDKEIGRVTPPEQGFWQFGEFGELAPGVENPWRFGSKMAPFDQEFYVIMNLAVGGVNFFPDDASNPDDKPWNNLSPTAPRDFYSQRDRWLPTWGLDNNDGESASLQVDYVRIWAL